MRSSLALVALLPLPLPHLSRSPCLVRLATITRTHSRRTADASLPSLAAQDPYAPYPGERPKPMGDVFKSLLPGSRRKSNAAADAQLAAAQPVTTHGSTRGGVLTSAPPAHGHTAGGGGGGGGIASKIPGTKAYEAAHPGHEHAHGTTSTAPMGAAGFGHDGSRPGGYGATSTEATVGSGHGGAGVASMGASSLSSSRRARDELELTRACAATVPGTKAHSAARASLSFLFSLFLRDSGVLPRPSLTLSPRSAPTDDHHSAHAHHVTGSTGLKPGDPGTTTTTTTTTVPKPSFGDKLSGA